MPSNVLVDAATLRVYTQCISTEGSVRTKIQKWGNSLGLRIPRSLAEEAGVEAGSEVDLSIRRGDLVVKPARRTKYRLNDLLRQMTSKNIHAGVDAGAPVGREAC